MFGEVFNTMTGVHEHYEAMGQPATRGCCGRCEREQPVYDWPFPGLGKRCAACIVIESGGGENAA